MKIGEVKKIHLIEYRLKDVKVTVNQDFKYDVGDMKIDGISGDTINMPRWLAELLSKDKIVTLNSIDMITQLKQSLSKEKMVGENQMSTLDSLFYIKLKDFMTALNKDDFNEVEGMMFDLFRMRRGKLIKIADATKLNSELYDKLTVEETVFFKTIHENSVEFENEMKK